MEPQRGTIVWTGCVHTMQVHQVQYAVPAGHRCVAAVSVVEDSQAGGLPSETISTSPQHNTALYQTLLPGPVAAARQTHTHDSFQWHSGLSKNSSCLSVKNAAAAGRLVANVRNVDSSQQTLALTFCIDKPGVMSKAVSHQAHSEIAQQ